VLYNENISDAMDGLLDGCIYGSGMMTVAKQDRVGRKGKTKQIQKNGRNIICVR
jgi:hypothetical protein